MNLPADPAAQAAHAAMGLQGVALACAALIGFAAHRASLCNVRAVAELMGPGSAHMLGSLLQAVLWMATLTGAGVLFFGWPLPPVLRSTPVAWALAGGALFGVGAALNGGCSLSTLHRLADGELGMLATLVGFVAGVAAWALAPGHAGLALVPVPSVWTHWPTLAPWLLGGLALWVLWQLVTMLRRARQAARASARPAARWLLRHGPLAPAYHLSAAAAVMGLAAGLLYATQGAWSYTNHLRSSVLHAVGAADASPAPTAWRGVLVLAVVAGMLLSSWQRGAFRWRLPASASQALRHGAGGLLMGAGAAMVPGGNDTLLLVALPTLTTAAAATYVAMLAGTAGVLWAMRRARLPLPTLACSPAGCHETGGPRP